MHYAVFIRVLGEESLNSNDNGEKNVKPQNEKRKNDEFSICFRNLTFLQDPLLDTFQNYRQDFYPPVCLR